MIVEAQESNGKDKEIQQSGIRRRIFHDVCSPIEVLSSEIVYRFCLHWGSREREIVFVSYLLYYFRRSTPPSPRLPLSFFFLPPVPIFTSCSLSTCRFNCIDRLESKVDIESLTYILETEGKGMKRDILRLSFYCS